ncbi:hypothetical protein DEJ50_27090 [Streptomyces venezuelae]|uniref:Uncharacterized protein n=1 Tax=Streptomyces venezuelae TaxID=54571 RepID=A0A5P2D9S9_STRVZ|nr:hypothetical protein DEJ50_27090 [Streptomyces venezuelae]
MVPGSSAGPAVSGPGAEPSSGAAVLGPAPAVSGLSAEPGSGAAGLGPASPVRGPSAEPGSGAAGLGRAPAVPGPSVEAGLAPAVAGPVAGADGRRNLVAAVLCGVLGLVLVCGAGVAAWQDHRDAARPPSAEEQYRRAGTLWHETPVDVLFPPRLDTDGAGPGGADRAWTRIAVAPDADCPAALPADWQQALAGSGCTRVLRATYTDVTRSTLVTVGLVFTPAEAGAEAVSGLRDRLPMPSGLGFDAEQRAAWTVSVRSDAPVVVYAVSAFTDGRAVKRPLTAEEAMNPETEGAVARAGLGHAVRAVAGAVEKSLGARVAPPSPEPKR